MSKESARNAVVSFESRVRLRSSSDYVTVEEYNALVREISKVLKMIIEEIEP